MFAQTPIADIPGWKREEQGGNFRFVPLTGAAGKTFLYDLQPLRKGNGESGSSWFKGLVASDVERTGYFLPANDNGFSPEPRFNNGQVMKQAFYFYPDSKETMGIGTSAYVPAGEKK